MHRGSKGYRYLAHKDELVRDESTNADRIIQFLYMLETLEEGRSKGLLPHQTATGVQQQLIKSISIAAGSWRHQRNRLHAQGRRPQWLMTGSEAVQEVAMPETGDAQPQAQNPAVALQAKLNQGMALHRQGKLADAERYYGEVLQRQPNHFDALHLLGVIAHQTRRTERGVELIKRAIGLNPKVAEAHNNLGNALRDLKRPAEALASYDKAIALKPDFAGRTTIAAMR